MLFVLYPCTLCGLAGASKTFLSMVLRRFPAPAPDSVTEAIHIEHLGASESPDRPDIEIGKKIETRNFENDKKSILDIFEYVVRTLSLDTLGTRGRL